MSKETFRDRLLRELDRAAFSAMRGGAGEFVTIVVARERAISEALLAGDDTVLRWRPQS